MVPPGAPPLEIWHTKMSLGYDADFQHAPFTIPSHGKFASDLYAIKEVAALGWSITRCFGSPSPRPRMSRPYFTTAHWSELKRPNRGAVDKSRLLALALTGKKDILSGNIEANFPTPLAGESGPHHGNRDGGAAPRTQGLVKVQITQER